MGGHLIFGAAGNTTDVAISIDGYFAPVRGSNSEMNQTGWGHRSP